MSFNKNKQKSIMMKQGSFKAQDKSKSYRKVVIMGDELQTSQEVELISDDLYEERVNTAEN
jgi:hypothetical protein